MNAIDETQRLAALYRLKVLDTPAETRFDRITRLAVKVLDAPSAYVSLVAQDRQWCKSSVGDVPVEVAREDSFCHHTIAHEGVLVVEDARSDPRFAASSLVEQDPFLRFYAGAPLRSIDGFAVGSFCIVAPEPRRLARDEVRLLRDFAALVEDQLNLVSSVDLQQSLVATQAELRETVAALDVRNRFIEKALGCYLPDAVAAEVMASPDGLALAGRRCSVSALLADLRGFTGMTNELDADQIVAVLNTYLGVMIDVVHSHGGTIDNLVGDGMVVFFGVPVEGVDDATRSVACALAMVAAMPVVNDQLERLGLPSLSVGIGISTGAVVAGNIGSADRMNYSAIGGAVNLASRLEAIAVGGQVLIDDRTLAACDPKPALLGSLRVKIRGIGDPVRVHEVGPP